MRLKTVCNGKGRLWMQPKPLSLTDILGCRSSWERPDLTLLTDNLWHIGKGNCSLIIFNWNTKKNVLLMFDTMSCSDNLWCQNVNVFNNVLRIRKENQCLGKGEELPWSWPLEEERGKPFVLVCIVIILRRGDCGQMEICGKPYSRCPYTPCNLSPLHAPASCWWPSQAVATAKYFNK